MNTKLIIAEEFVSIQGEGAPLNVVLDHYYLNEIDGLENPTSENLARWIYGPNA